MHCVNFVVWFCKFVFGGPTEQRWSFYVSGPVSQLGISQLWLDQMVLPYVSLTFPRLPFCHLLTYLLDQLLSRTDGTIGWSFRNVGFIGKKKQNMADSQGRSVFSKQHHSMWGKLPCLLSTLILKTCTLYWSLLQRGVYALHVCIGTDTYSM